MRLGFFSTMGGPQSGIAWAASEELWCQSARTALDRGHSAFVNYSWWPQLPKPLQELERHGAHLSLRRSDGVWRKAKKYALRRMGRPARDSGRWLDQCRPDLVAITVPWHIVKLSIAKECIRRGIPYVLSFQNASPNTWIRHDDLELYREAIHNAAETIILSQNNVDILEANVATTIPRVRVLDVPVNPRCDSASQWPESNGEVRLACIGRFDFATKGQDLILQVLRADKWRARSLRVVFWGTDDGNLRQLRDLIDMYDLHDHAEIGGFNSDIKQLWSQHQALLLPSRCEGIPLVTVEAMMCGRIPIVTDCGRNGELVDDNETGFIAASPHATSLDEAMERAWKARNRWQQMGQLASQRINEHYSKTPVDDFVSALEELGERSMTKRNRK